MFDKLKYKQKKKLLILVIVLMGFIIYNMFIAESISIYNNYTELEAQFLSASVTPSQVEKTERDLMKAENIIEARNFTGADVEQSLLELVSNYCNSNKAILRDFPKVDIAYQKDILIESNVFVVEGSFDKLINLVYQLEQKSKLGQVSSVEYQLKKDLLSRKMALTATIYLQNIKKQKNEK